MEARCGKLVINNVGDRCGVQADAFSDVSQRAGVVVGLGGGGIVPPAPERR